MQHLVIFRLSAMGDVAMTVPVITALVQQHQVKVTVVSRPFFKPFFEQLPNVDFYPVDLKGKHKGVMGMWRLYKALKKKNITAFVEFHNVLRSKIVRSFFALSGTPTAFTDKGRAEKKALTSATAKVFVPLKTMFQRHADALAQLGFPVDLEHVQAPAPRGLTAAVLRLTQPKAGNWIGIAPFAQYQTKVYPTEKMKEVVLKLAEKPENTLFLFGGGDKEIDLLKKMQQGLQNVIVVAGKLSLEEELALISNLNVMLSMDSGNAHIAAMLGTPVVTLWGNTHPYAGFAPFQQPLENALTPDRTLYPKIPTSVYGNKIVPGYETVIGSIAPDAVVAKIDALIS